MIIGKVDLKVKGGMWCACLAVAPAHMWWQVVANDSKTASPKNGNLMFPD